MSQENPAPPMSRKSIRKANRRNREEAEEAARIQAEAVRFQEEARRRTLSPFQRIIPTNRLIPIVLSDADREYGVYAIFDFECAMHDFPSSFPMTIFIPQLEAMLARVFGVTYKILSVYGAGSYSVFVNNLKRANDFVFQDEVEMKFLPNRLSYCDCSNLVTPGPHRTSNYSRASDRACDVLSQAMSAYPTTVGHRDGLTCNILVITGDRDLGSAMRTLKKRGVRVMLAFNGDHTSNYLRRSATNNYVINFKQQFFT